MVIVASIIAFIMAVVAIIAYPFKIGKEKTDKTFTVSGYMYTLFESALIILMAGHILGWW